MECRELTQAAFASGSKTVEMGDNVFARCYNLAKVTLPSRINRVGAGMFMDILRSGIAADGAGICPHAGGCAASRRRDRAAVPGVGVPGTRVGVWTSFSGGGEHR